MRTTLDVAKVRFANYPYLGHEALQVEGFDVLRFWDDRTQITRVIVCVNTGDDVETAESLAARLETTTEGLTDVIAEVYYAD